MSAQLPHRVIWLFGLGYFATYAPYVASVKLVTGGGASGLFILPGVIAGTAVALPLLIWLLGWQKHLGGRFSPSVVTSGIGTAAIIATTTIAYSFDGISIILALLLMRGGVLVLAPIVDAFGGRRVRWFARAALGLSLGAIIIALANVEAYTMTAAAVLNLGVYLAGYCVRLPVMTRLAKVDDVQVTRRYFAQETIVALTALVLMPPVYAVLRPHSELARGVAEIWTSAQLLPSLAIGVFYALLYTFGTLVYLDRRENSFCIPLNRGASLLSGITAAYLLAAFAQGRAPATTELLASVLVVAALTLLSPMHHTVEVLHETWRISRTALSRRLPLE